MPQLQCLDLDATLILNSMYMCRKIEQEFVWLLHDLTTKLSAAEQVFIAIFGQTLESLPNADTRVKRRETRRIFTVFDVWLAICRGRRDSRIFVLRPTPSLTQYQYCLGPSLAVGVATLLVYAAAVMRRPLGACSLRVCYSALSLSWPSVISLRTVCRCTIASFRRVKRRGSGTAGGWKWSKQG